MSSKRFLVIIVKEPEDEGYYAYSSMLPLLFKRQDR